MKSPFVLLVAMLTLAGCLGTARLPRDFPVPGEAETIFVLGVAPEDYSVRVGVGSVRSGVFHESLLLLPAIVGKPENGYLVGRTRAGRALAITSVWKHQFGTEFIPCASVPTVVFEAGPGQVVYVGTVQFTQDRSGISTDYSADLERARRYLATTYPVLADRLEQGTYELLPTSARCTG